MVKLLYFSVIREAIKKDSETLDFSGSVGELRELLKSKYPQISNLLDRVKFAVNEEYVEDTFRIGEGATVAIIPPVSGG